MSEATHPAAARNPRVLLVGGAPARLSECAVLWQDLWWELVPPWFGRMTTPSGSSDDFGSIELVDNDVDAFVRQALGFDVVTCESPEALILNAECRRRGQRPPAILIVEVHGPDAVRRLAAATENRYGADAWHALTDSTRVAWIALSNAQRNRLLEAGVSHQRLARIDMSALVYRVMLTHAAERFAPDLAVDAHLAPDVPGDVVLVAGTAHRDTATWLASARLLPDIPFVALGETSAELATWETTYGIKQLRNVSVVPFLPLEAFIAVVRRARVSVVCLRPGDADAGQTTASVSQALGVPVVASRVPCMMDYVEDGFSGRFVPTQDPRALATAIRWLWEDRTIQDRLAAGGRLAERERRARTERALRQVIGELLAA